jgi:PTS system mannose-specific IIB component
MNLVLVRIDDRFIHGQILEAWIPYLDANAVIVANDCLASDDFQKAIMAMAIPDRIFFQIVSVDEASKLVEEPLLEGKKVLLIVATIRDAYEIYKKMPFNRLNIGNIKVKDGCKQLSCSVWIEQEEINMLKELINRGVCVGIQVVPREREIECSSLIGTTNP